MLRSLLFFLFLVVSLPLIAQIDTTFYLDKFGAYSLEEGAAGRYELRTFPGDSMQLKKFGVWKEEWQERYSEHILEVAPQTYRIITVRSYTTDTIFRKITLLDQGWYEFEDVDNQKKIKMTGKASRLFPLYKEGEVKRYYSNGQISDISIYKENQLVSNQRWYKDGERGADNVFQVVEEEPEFPGGHAELYKYLNRNIQYPRDALKARKEGKAYLSFVIMEDGRLEELRVLRSAGYPALDVEALRVVSQFPEWTPGKHKGKPVRTSFILPITFRLH